MNHRMDLPGRNIIVFDLETKHECGTPEVPWDRKDLMGVSVGVAFDYRTCEYRVFMDDNLADLASLLCQADLVTGFNIDGFDTPLLEATLKGMVSPLPGDLPPIRSYDMLLESRRAVGWAPGRSFPKGLRLDDHLLGTFGKDSMKTDDGANAPKLWQERKLGDLISYCIADVKREAMLFEQVWARNAINTSTHGFRRLSDPRKKLPGYVDEKQEASA